MDIQQLFIYLGLAAILVELVLGAATGFDLLLFGLAMVAGGIIGNLTDNDQLSLISAIFFAGLYIFFGRRLVRNKLFVKTRNTNIDDLVDKTGVCTKKIALDHAGQAKIGTEIWRAESDEEIEVGYKLKVIAVEGVSVKVKKIIN